MTTFYTSDTHFGDAYLLKEYRDRSRFSTVEDHDNAIIDLWNNTVSPNDTVYHLGDFAVRSTLEHGLDCFSKLNGNITIIAGNHDPFWVRQHTPHLQNTDWEDAKHAYEEAGATIIESGRLDHTFAGIDCVLSHLPLVESEKTLYPGHPYNLAGECVPSWERRPIVCGHVHGQWRIFKNCINVGLDSNNFSIVPEDYLEFYIRHSILEIGGDFERV